MPADDRARLDDQEAGTPISPEPGQPHPEEPITLLQPWALHGSLKNDQLLSKGQVLRCDGRTTQQRRSEQAHDDVDDAHSVLQVRT